MSSPLADSGARGLGGAECASEQADATSLICRWLTILLDVPVFGLRGLTGIIFSDLGFSSFQGHLHTEKIKEANARAAALILDQK